MEIAILGHEVLVCFVTQQQLTDTWRDGEMRQRRDNYEGQQKNIMKTVHSVYTEPGLQLEALRVCGGEGAADSGQNRNLCILECMGQCQKAKSLASM